MSQIPVQNLYYLLCYAWESFEERDLADVGDVGAFNRLEDFFGLILARAVHRLTRRGLDRSYVSERQLVAGVRGKLDFGATISGGTLMRHRTVCEVDELSADILPNRIVAATLDTLLGSTLAPKVREEVRLARDRMGALTPLRISDGAFRSAQPSQSRRSYRFLLAICQLLHRSILVAEQGDTVRFQGIDLESLTRWRIFELFAARFYAREQGIFKVRAQRQLQWFDLDGSSEAIAKVPVMRPDLVLESSTRRVVIDTKFYKKSLSEAYGVRKAHSGHLYQMFAYVMNRERQEGAGPRHEGILLYPTVGDRIHVDFSTHFHWIRVRSVDLGREWPSVEQEMLEVLEISPRHLAPNG